jgi:hypothetical protein
VTIWLDWRPEDFEMIPKSGRVGLTFDCHRLDDGHLSAFHQPVDQLRAAFMEIAECLVCEKPIFRPSKSAPTGMAYRWAMWNYVIQEEP